MLKLNPQKHICAAIAIFGLLSLGKNTLASQNLYMFSRIIKKIELILLKVIKMGTSIQDGKFKIQW